MGFHRDCTTAPEAGCCTDHAHSRRRVHIICFYLLLRSCIGYLCPHTYTSLNCCEGEATRALHYEFYSEASSAKRITSC